MSTLLRALGVAWFVLLAASPLNVAQLQPTADERRRVEEYQTEKNSQNLKDWEGVLLYCYHDKENQALKEICEKTYTNAAFLASVAKVNLIRANDLKEFGFASKLGERLLLLVDLSSTKQGLPTAIHATSRAYAGYLRAVEASSLEKDKKGARTTPRDGDLIFWERSVIGASSGTSRDLVAPISDAIEQHLKQFFADYLNAQR